MNALKEPSKRLARRALREVGYEERFEGYTLRERSGAVQVVMYRFGEIVSFLDDDYPRMDIGALEEWVRNTMGDRELADHIKAALAEAGTDQDRTSRIKVLMEERLRQYKTLQFSKRKLA